MNKNQKLALMVAGAGVAANIADAFTANGDATGGVLYGTNGWLKTVNDKLPLNLGLLAIVAGLGAFFYLKYR